MVHGTLKHQSAYTCNGLSIDATSFYATACDPKRTVAVEACAGAGKTWMLVSRILRALLKGVKPESILAITFTKKAAGEMRERLFEWLHNFAEETDEEKLIEELVSRGISIQAAPALVPKLKGLHAELLSDAKGVEIRTFHGWFAQLLSACPLGVLDELGLPVKYDLIEDDTELFKPVWYKVLRCCTEDESLRADMNALLQQLGVFNTEKALRAVWSRRLEFTLADQYGVIEQSVCVQENPLVLLSCEEFVVRWLNYAKLLGQEERKTPQNAAIKIEAALTTMTDPEKRLLLLRGALFTAKEDRLTRYLADNPVAQQAAEELTELLAQYTQYQAYQYQQRMARLTRVLLSCYAEYKREEGVVDMADLERVAQRLLGDTETYGWVAQRLDARISLVLIDEFQDTNPLQWQALRGWLSAYAGTGGGGRMSIFIVGDPKQSIYRFRRADPSVFIAACDFLKNTLAGDMLACDHTRRNAPEVMRAVNAVFDVMREQQGYEGFRSHTTASNAPGQVACLPMVLRMPKDKSDEDDDEIPQWRDSLTEPRYQAEEKLRMQEVRQVTALLKNWVEQEGWQYSDIKILSRRKERLRELIVELNQHHIPWRFSDDVLLSETLEVQDIIALLDALASPTHDLSLAQALRCPVFGHDDEDLMFLAEQVRQLKERSEGDASTLADPVKHSWWAVLQQATEDEESGQACRPWPGSMRQTAQLLKRWKLASQYLPPHDLLDQIYNDADVLNKYAKAVPAAMRSSVLANLRSLLQQALLLNSGRYATPYNFVRAMRSKGVKSEHPEDANAVELLTIHGAKGLEARGIIVLDTDAEPTRKEHLSVLMDWPAEQLVPARFIFYLNQKSLPSEALVLAQKEEIAERREELNTLYVAMTRARERLIFSALQSSRDNDNSWWRHLDGVAEQAGVCALEHRREDLAILQDYAAGGEKEKVLTSLFNFGPEASVASMQPFDTMLLPKYEAEPLLIEARADAVHDMLQAETGLTGVARATMTSQDMQTQAQRFGEAVHRMLELENTAPEVQQTIASELGLIPQQVQEAAAKAHNMMTHPQAQRFFDAKQCQEIHKEVALHYQGRVMVIDRLVLMDNIWWILDFKSAAHPLKYYGDDYREQLAQYKAALLAMLPGNKIRTALLTGEGELLEL